MSFLYPLGLLGLIGIPVLIIIYIIKNKYTEQTVASTYLWTLSERFLKRRNPISKIAGIVSLLLQILAVFCVSVALAHPVFTLKNAANEYCFVLDASGSMNLTENGSTRFDEGKREIQKLIEKAADGSTFSLVYAGDTASVVFEKTEDKKSAISSLNALSATYAQSNLTDAVAIAQGYFNESPSILTYLITDTTYRSHENIQLVNVSGEAVNYSVSDLLVTTGEEGVFVDGKVYAHGKDGSLTVKLFVDGAETATTTAQTTDGEGSFRFELTTTEFSSLKATLDVNDALKTDNEFVLFDAEKENARKTLLVSDQPFYLHAFLHSVGNGEQTTVCYPEDYANASGYDLYIFDGFTPDQMPTDGAVWLFGLNESLPEAGFSVQGEVTFDSSEALTLTDSSESVVKTLTDGLTDKEDVRVIKYVKYGLYRNFTTLYSYKNSIPMIFTGTNTYGYREVVFAFDLHDSNFPVLYDFPVLMGNLWTYSFPKVVEEVTYACGEEIEINQLPNCKSIRVESPTGKATYLQTGGGANTFRLDEVGVYTIVMSVGETQKKYYVYSAFDKAESAVSVTESEIKLQGEATDGAVDGKYDKLIVIFVLLSLLFVADWGVYCYDKYQLR